MADRRGEVDNNLRTATNLLSATSDTPRLDAELLMAHALGIDRQALLLDSSRYDVPESFVQLVARRMAAIGLDLARLSRLDAQTAIAVAASPEWREVRAFLTAPTPAREREELARERLRAACDLRGVLVRAQDAGGRARSSPSKPTFSEAPRSSRRRRAGARRRMGPPAFTGG